MGESCGDEQGRGREERGGGGGVGEVVERDVFRGERGGVYGGGGGCYMCRANPKRTMNKTRCCNIFTLCLSICLNRTLCVNLSFIHF